MQLQLAEEHQLQIAQKLELLPTHVGRLDQLLMMPEEVELQLDTVLEVLMAVPKQTIALQEDQLLVDQLEPMDRAIVMEHITRQDLLITMEIKLGIPIRMATEQILKPTEILIQIPEELIRQAIISHEQTQDRLTTNHQAQEVQAIPIRVQDLLTLG